MIQSRACILRSSIGDSQGHAAGVIPHPDVMERMVVEGIDKYLILCSDGVWEFISEQEAVDIVSLFPPEQVGPCAL